MNTERADILLSKQKGISRALAQEYIVQGRVFAEGKTVAKTSLKLPAETVLDLVLPEETYVSRGGYKLAKALKEFKIDITGKVCADIGASTGGFTDCLLQNNAVKVYAIDSGKAQLAEKLLGHEKIVLKEGLNAKDLTPELLGEKVDFICADLSFISLTKILKPVADLLKPEGDLVCLIKPQFEVGKGKVGKNGIVKNPAEHIRVIGDIIAFAKENKLFTWGLGFSPIKGSNGNIEYLIHLKFTENNRSYNIKATVTEALEGVV